VAGLGATSGRGIGRAFASVPEDSRGRRSGRRRTSEGVRHDWARRDSAYCRIPVRSIEPNIPVATAIEGLKEIAERHPDSRTECVGILARTLEQHADADGSINGFAVSALIDLAAVEVIDTMREAFRRNSVDISIAGDEEDVEIALGFRECRSTPAPVYQIVPTSWLASSDADRIQLDNRVLPQHRKVGRNDPCTCGSGKKYKKCCLQ
jgi:hypothetical protein